jgi:hypothetical protein
MNRPNKSGDISSTQNTHVMNHSGPLYLFTLNLHYLTTCSVLKQSQKFFRNIIQYICITSLTVKAISVLATKIPWQRYLFEPLQEPLFYHHNHHQTESEKKGKPKKALRPHFCCRLLMRSAADKPDMAMRLMEGGMSPEEQ